MGGKRKPGHIRGVFGKQVPLNSASHGQLLREPGRRVHVLDKLLVKRVSDANHNSAQREPDEERRQ